MKKNFIYRIYLIVLFLEGIFSLFKILQEKSETQSSLLFGYSLTRLLMILGVFAFIVVLLVILVRGLKNNTWEEKVIYGLQSKLASNKIYYLFIGGSIILFLFPIIPAVFYLYFPHSLMFRLSPLIGWLSLFGLANLIFVPVFRNPASSVKQLFDIKIFWPSLISFAILFVSGIFVYKTGIGLEPIGDWETLGVPLFPLEVFYAWGIMVGFLSLYFLLEKFGKGWLLTRKIDILIAVALFIAAVVIWQSEPMRHSFFNPAPVPPNNEYYPDAGPFIYDVIAQNALAGEGYKLNLDNEKPFYTFTLTIFRAIGGQDYLRTVNVQIVFLALIPVVLYFVGILFYNRGAGLVLAVLAIIRERNAISLTGKIDISHSKYFLTEMLAYLCTVVFVYLMVRWVRNKRIDQTFAIGAGGVMGLLMLTRNQSIILASIVVLLLVITLYKKWNQILFGLGLFVLGLVLAMSPWLVRNTIVTGSPFTVLPNKGAALLDRWDVFPDYEPDLSQFTTFQDGVKEMVNLFIQKPGGVTHLVASHFIHNEITTIAIFPTGYPYLQGAIRYHQDPSRDFVKHFSVSSLKDYMEMFPYWGKWDGTVSSQSFLPILVNFLLISVGIGVAWKRLRWAGIFPIFVHMIFNIGSSAWGISGWRFMLPVDWIGILYFSIGIAFLTQLVFSFISAKQKPTIPPQELPVVEFDFSLKKTVLIGAVVLIIGLAIPVLELVVPQQYYQVSKPQAIELVNETLAGAPNDLIDQLIVLIEQEGIEVHMGRAIYPRFFQFGESGIRFPHQVSQDYNRLSFHLVGPENLYITLPIEQSPSYFPSGQSVLLIGCRVPKTEFVVPVEDKFLAQAVVFLDSSGIYYLASQSCP